MAQDVDCTSYLDLTADPDVAGIGVVTGFLGTAWTIILFLLLYYIFGYDPLKDPFESKKNTGLRPFRRPNPIDVLFHSLIFRFRRGSKQPAIGRSSEKTKKLDDIFNQTVMAMSDLQILSGLSIFISGYFALQQGLSVYHWQMIIRLAWFTTITHLAALTCLRSYFYRNPRKRLSRSILMGILAVALIATTLPSGDLPQGINSYAICYYRLPWTPDVNVILSCLLIAHNAVIRMTKLHESTSSWATKFKGYFIKPAKACFRLVYTPYGRGSFRLDLLKHMLLVQPYVAVLTIINTYLILYSSFAAEIFALLVAAVWGTLRLVSLRSSGPPGEGDWSFGQVIPIVMLFAPFLILADRFDDLRSIFTSDSQHASVDPVSHTVTIPINDQDRVGDRNTTRLPYFEWSQPLHESAVNREEYTRLQLVEKLSLSTLSIMPMKTFVDYESSYRPCLDYFEDLSWFKPLIFQLCCCVVFVTLYVFFLDFQQQDPIDAALGMSTWLLLAVPFFHVLFILCWPKSRSGPMYKWVVHVIRPILSVLFSSLPIISFYCLSDVYETLIGMGIFWFAYICFSLGWIALSPNP